jgi:hypothetical protein
VVLRGPRGAGVTRLAAQFASELADMGVPVEYRSDAVQPAEPTPRPVLSVVDLRRSANGPIAIPAGISVDDPTKCRLQRIGTQLVKCDNLTGAGVNAPAWIPVYGSAYEGDR